MSPLQDPEKDPPIEISRFGPAEDPLKNLEPPITPEVSRQAMAAISKLKERVREGFRTMKFKLLREAQAKHGEAEQRLEESSQRLKAAEERLANHKGGSFVRGALSAICFKVCFLAEVVFNRATLPWLLNVSPDTVLGMALAVAPATAPVILDATLRNLFDFEDPWTGLKTAVLTPFGQRVRRAVSLFFVTAVVAGNLLAIWLVAADCRKVAARLMNAETAVGLSSQEEARVDRAIGALSIALCVDGALFYLLAAHELGGWHGRWTLRREVSRLRTAEDELRGALAQAEAELAVREAEWDRVEAEAQAAADEYEARQLLRLAQTAARRGPATGAYQRVKDMLDRSFSGPAGPRFMAPPAEA